MINVKRLMKTVSKIALNTQLIDAYDSIWFPVLISWWNIIRSQCWWMAINPELTKKVIWQQEHGAIQFQNQSCKGEYNGIERATTHLWEFLLSMVKEVDHLSELLS